MSGAIQTLRLRGFRGASSECEIRFDRSKRLVLIFGENGTGKSTITDAIDFVANEQVGSLQDRSVGTKLSYLQTVGRPSSELVVEAALDGSVWNGEIKNRKIHVSGTGERVRARVLRRPALQKIAEAQPAERYKQLQMFIDVHGVERSEAALRNALQSTQTSVDEAARLVTDAKASLESLWAKEGEPDGSALEWARRKVEASQDDLRQRLHRLAAFLSALATCDDRLARLTQAEGKAATTASEHTSAQRSAQNLSPIEGLEAAGVVALLEEARTLLTRVEEADSCPVCRQSIVREELVKSIEERLSALSEHREVTVGLQRASTALTAAEGAARLAAEDFAESIGAAQRTAKALGLPSEPATEGTEASPLEPLLASKQLHQQLTSKRATVHAQSLAAQADVNQYTAIKTAFERIEENTRRAQDSSELSKGLERALETCTTTRLAYTQKVLDSIQEELNCLYETVHPNEMLGPLRLAMDPAKRGSIDQDATFVGHAGVPPQAYFSESHLDTLGFCVWLILAKHDRPKETVLVLDDIFTSSDSVHLSRILPVLSSVAGEFAQIIATTHYRPWRDRYRLAQAPGLEVQLLELHRWSLNRGVCLTGTKLAVDQLEDAIASTPIDRQSVASQAGILLEAVLDRLTLQYALRLPRTRDGHWTLGDLLSACKKLFERLTIERVSVPSSALPAPAALVTTALTPFFEDAGPLSFVRNQVGCHFNLVGSEVPNCDVEDFGRATAALVRAITCDGCGDVPAREDGSHFRCGCKRTRMAPLKFN